MVARWRGASRTSSAFGQAAGPSNIRSLAEFAPSVHAFHRKRISPPQRESRPRTISPPPRSHPAQEREIHRQRREKERHDREVDILLRDILDRMVRQVEKDDIRGDDGRVFRDSRCFQNGQIVAGVPPFEGKRWYFLHRVRGEPCTDFFGAPPKDRVFVRDPMLENQIKSQVRTYREQRRADAEARRAMAVAEAKAAKEAREAKDHMRLLQAAPGDTLRHRLQSAGHMRDQRGRQGGSRGSFAPPNNDRAMWDQIRAQQGHAAGPRDRWAEAAGFGRGRGVRPPPEMGEGTIGDVALSQTLAPGAPNAFV